MHRAEARDAYKGIVMHCAALRDEVAARQASSRIPRRVRPRGHEFLACVEATRRGNETSAEMMEEFGVACHVCRSGKVEDTLGMYGIVHGLRTRMSLETLGSATLGPARVADCITNG